MDLAELRSGSTVVQDLLREYVLTPEEMVELDERDPGRSEDVLDPVVEPGGAPLAAEPPFGLEPAAGPERPSPGLSVPPTTVGGHGVEPPGSVH